MGNESHTAHTAHTFSDLLSDALDARGVSPGEAARALKGMGLKIDRGTLTRWRNGETTPSLDKLDVVRRLPDALGMTSAERAAFLREAGRLLDFALVRERRPRPVAAVVLPQRIHFGADVLPPFAGRVAELALLQECVRDGRSVLITGLGGVGKTRLAQELLRSSVGYFAHGCEFLTLLPGQPGDQVLYNVAQLLGVPLPSGIPENGRALVLAGLRDQLRDARLLFLIDNVENADQVRDLIRELPSITWVITARRISLKSIGVYPVVLDLPPTEDAAAIFLAHAGGVHASGGEGSALVDEAIHVAGRLPIALRLMAGLMSSSFINSPAELEAWIQAGGLLRGGSHGMTLRRLFAQLVDSAPAEAQAIFEACGAFADRTIAMQRLLSVCLRAGIRPSPRIWEWLADLSLIELPDEGYVQLHPLLHTYAAARLRSSPRAAAIREGFRGVYLDLARAAAESAEPQRDYAALIPEEPNLLRVVDEYYKEGDWAGLRAMWPAVSGYLWHMGNLAAYEALDRKCLRAAWLSGDSAWVAVLLSELGFVALEMGRFDGAAELFRDSQAIHDAAPEQLIEQARLRRYRAALAMRLGRLDEALALLAECEQRLSTLTDPPESRLGIARVLLHSARMSAHRRRGDLPSAAAAGELADRQFRATVPDHSNRLGEYRLEWADVLYRLGDAAAAREMWLDISNRRGDDGLLPEQGEARLRLAWLAHHEAHHEARETAAEDARTVHRIFTRFGRVERLAQADALIAALGGGPLPAFEELTAGCDYPAY
ncbi:MAG TPA: AAA family ATPase [Promineifilum sp.]|nr:AAA family ATPase [Promineifilum sp.]HRQ14096.1 AAA family ATPase [Promineifilum sp.]HRQ14230.1 AAA family ATPase [Promineifilum sp.]